MNFGLIAHDNTAKTVTLTNAGTVTCPANYLCTGTPTTGQFTVAGQGTENISITLAGGILSDGNTHTLALTPTVASPTQALIAGAATINVGASFTTVANQTAGLYSTENSGGLPYTVTVNY